MHQSDLIATDIHAYLKQHETKGILRFLTCGSVDDGKSTLIGRLLHDSKMIYEDQLAAVAAASKTAGTQGDEVDLALLVDGLQAEREQGITIDVAYRYFSTTKRKFIIADTPGHEQYTRNMATGASNCDAAVILIDARPGHGVLPQTKRHSFIAAMLNIEHVLVAVNKMDAVGYSQDVFTEIKEHYLAFARRLNISDLHFIPISALKGDNIVTASRNMPWYHGGTLIHMLENVHIGAEYNHSGFRFPVQYVNRLSSEFRGYAGTVASGEARVGDKVMSLPSKKTSTIANITTFSGEQETASVSQAVTISLADELDISRGDMLVLDDDLPKLQDQFDAMLVWMSDNPATPGQQYLLKINHNLVVGTVNSIKHKVDIHTFEHQKTPTLALNEIGQVNISLARHMPMDSYHQNHSTGAFIVIDRTTNQTLSAGMVLSHDANASKDVWAAEPKTTRRISHHHSEINAVQRAQLLGHKAATILFVGLNGSGKTALGVEIESRLFKRGVTASLVDGQHLRLGLCRDLGFTIAERAENLRRGAELAKHINGSGAIALCCFVAQSNTARHNFQEIVGDKPCLIVYLDAPVEACRERDQHNLYVAADRGEIADFAGVSSNYEAPKDADLTLATAQLELAICADKVIQLLEAHNILTP